MTAPSTLPSPSTLALALTDRCDQCGAQAFVRATFYRPDLSASTLLFCGHHGTKHEARLTEQGATLYRQDVVERKNDTDH